MLQVLTMDPGCPGIPGGPGGPGGPGWEIIWTFSTNEKVETRGEAYKLSEKSGREPLFSFSAKFKTYFLKVTREFQTVSCVYFFRFSLISKMKINWEELKTRVKSTSMSVNIIQIFKATKQMVQNM